MKSLNIKQPIFGSHIRLHALLPYGFPYLLWALFIVLFACYCNNYTANNVDSYRKLVPD